MHNVLSRMEYLNFFILPFMTELVSDMDISVVAVSSTSLEFSGSTPDGEEFVLASVDNSQH